VTEVADARRILGLVGVFDAEGTLRGELTYWVGARLGRAHCALCSITHGTFRERDDWRLCRAGLPVPFATFHRDDQPTAVRDLLGTHLPAVVAVTEAAHVLLVGPDALDACHGSPEALVDALTTAAASAGLTWS
jgi:hypothetical protein